MCLVVPKILGHNLIYKYGALNRDLIIRKIIVAKFPNLLLRDIEIHHLVLGTIYNLLGTFMPTIILLYDYEDNL